jgi:hypothetical protein
MILYRNRPVTAANLRTQYARAMSRVDEIGARGPEIFQEKTTEGSVELTLLTSLRTEASNYELWLVQGANKIRLGVNAKEPLLPFAQLYLWLQEHTTNASVVISPPYDNPKTKRVRPR